jgi:hypothetical protein
VCEDAPAELEVKLGGSLQRASDILIPKLLALFTSPHDGIRAMVSALPVSALIRQLALSLPGGFTIAGLLSLRFRVLKTCQMLSAATASSDGLV